MERELVRSNELLFAQVTEICLIIHVINFDHIFVGILEEEIDLNRLNKFGVRTVIQNLSLRYHLLLLLIFPLHLP